MPILADNNPMYRCNMPFFGLYFAVLNPFLVSRTDYVVLFCEVICKESAVDFAADNYASMDELVAASTSLIGAHTSTFQTAMRYQEAANALRALVFKGHPKNCPSEMLVIQFIGSMDDCHTVGHGKGGSMKWFLNARPGSTGSLNASASCRIYVCPSTVSEQPISIASFTPF